MSSGFISETEIAEKRKCRQEEWEKVRKPDQPLEAPEEEYDHRSLFDRLQEQKQKREFEYEEAHRLKHMIKGLDDDEVEFLDLVDRSKLEEERKKRGEEAREMADFRSAVASLHEHSLDKRIQLELKAGSRPATAPISNSYTSQTKLLAGAVVKKRPADDSSAVPVKKTKTEDDAEESVSSDTSKPESTPPQTTKSEGITPVTGLKCIGILPGISYSESSDSATSDSDDECDSHHSAVDMIGRKLISKQKVASEAE